MNCLSCSAEEVTEKEEQLPLLYGVEPEFQVTLTVTQPTMTCNKCGFKYTDYRGEDARTRAVDEYERSITIKVHACSWSAKGKAMGDLVHEGIMTKHYECQGNNPDAYTIIWHLKKEAGVIVDNGYEVMHPGDTVRWDK